MNTNPEVETYLINKAHPLDAEIRRVREIILASSLKIEKCIKWSSPTFVYKGNMASFFMNAKKHVSLMFHTGSVLQDESGILTGEDKEARTAKFINMAEIETRKADLELVVQKWINIKDELIENNDD